MRFRSRYPSSGPAAFCEGHPSHVHVRSRRVHARSFFRTIFVQFSFRFSRDIFCCNCPTDIGGASGSMGAKLNLSSGPPIASGSSAARHLMVAMQCRFDIEQAPDPLVRMFSVLSGFHTSDLPTLSFRIAQTLASAAARRWGVPSCAVSRDPAPRCSCTAVSSL